MKQWKKLRAFVCVWFLWESKQLFELWFIGGAKIQVTDLHPTPLTSLLFPGMYALQGSEGICVFFFFFKHLSAFFFFFTCCILLRSFKCSRKFVQNGHCTNKMQDYLLKVQLWKNCRRNLWIFSNYFCAKLWWLLEVIYFFFLHKWKSQPWDDNWH